MVDLIKLMGVTNRREYLKSKGGFRDWDAMYIVVTT